MYSESYVDVVAMMGGGGGEDRRALRVFMQNPVDWN